MKIRPWLSLTFFILSLILLAALATLWNLSWILSWRNYSVNVAFDAILGIAGFLIILTGILIFYIQSYQERKINELQREFLTSVTHELKTPLATLELTASLLRQPDLSREDQEALWTAHSRDLTRLRHDVESLLEASRFSAVREPPDTTAILFYDWIEKETHRWKVLLNEPPRTFKVSLTALKKIEIQTDAKLLRMILDNLIENARKFTQDHGTISLRTSFQPVQNNVVKWTIEVQDDGLGFNPSDSKKIFNKFYRIQNSDHKKIHGTGLGLYLVRVACKRLDLKIQAFSQGRGRGSSFVITGFGKVIP